MMLWSTSTVVCSLGRKRLQKRLRAHALLYMPPGNVMTSTRSRRLSAHTKQGEDPRSNKMGVHSSAAAGMVQGDQM
jgi:hypothetical protein